MAKRRLTKKPLRFAHPFFMTTPIEKRKRHPGVGKRLLDHIKGKLQPVPPVDGDSLMTLADVIGANSADNIAASGSIRFHAVGDTGRDKDSPQGDVAEAMASDFDVGQPATCPAFFFHLGDVIYGHDKDPSYRREFYEPYAHYPGKIIAIPGNHDGEVFPLTDPKSLRAFIANFCAAAQRVPPVAGSIFRQTMNQPGAFWRLNAPFVDIVGMYSNAAENPGFISGGAAGVAQKQWLVKTLSAIATDRKRSGRKALVFATHHPPYTSGGHSPSHEMLADIDDACRKASIMPDLFLSGHSHNYQRYTRKATANGSSVKIPYIVAGTGGINDGRVPSATKKTTNNITFEASKKGYGYLLIEIDRSEIVVRFIAVDGSKKSEYDHFTVKLT